MTIVVRAPDVCPSALMEFDNVKHHGLYLRAVVQVTISVNMHEGNWYILVSGVMGVTRFSACVLIVVTSHALIMPRCVPKTRNQP